MAEEGPAFLFINRGLHNVFPIKCAALMQLILWYVCVFKEGDPPNVDYPTKPLLQRPLTVESALAFFHLANDLQLA